MRLMDSLLHSLAGVRSNGDLHRSLQVHLSLDSLSVLEDRVQPSTSPVDLGAAGDFAVLGLQRTDIQNDNSSIAGDVGVSRRGSLWNSAGSSIAGNVDAYSSGQYRGRGAVSGAFNVDPALLTQADHDARDASAVAAALSPTQSFRRINRDTTVTGNGGLNVISVRGDITASLTLQGGTSDIFIVNVRGDLRLRGTESLALDGVSAEHVIFNFTGRHGWISAGAGALNGTLLAPRYSVHLHGTAVNGEIIAGGDEIDFRNHASVTQKKFDTGPGNSGPQTGTSLTGFVYDDKNFNGVMDPGEEKSGVTMTLTDGNGGTVTAVSQTDGSYSFGNNLTAGTYTLSADSFFGVATPGTVNGTAMGDVSGGMIAGITLVDGDIAEGYLFGYRPNS